MKVVATSCFGMSRPTGFFCRMSVKHGFSLDSRVSKTWCYDRAFVEAQATASPVPMMVNTHHTQLTPRVGHSESSSSSGFSGRLRPLLTRRQTTPANIGENQESAQQVRPDTIRKILRNGSVVLVSHQARIKCRAIHCIYVLIVKSRTQLILTCTDCVYVYRYLGYRSVSDDIRVSLTDL